MTYESTRAALARAHDALQRTAGIDADIAERRRLRDLGLLPEPHMMPSSPEPPPLEEQTLVLDADDFPTGMVAISEEYPKPPIQCQADIEAARILSSAFAKELLAQIIAVTRSDCLDEIDALRAEIKALKSRRRSKSKDRSDESTN